MKFLRRTWTVRDFFRFVVVNFLVGAGLLFVLGTLLSYQRNRTVSHQRSTGLAAEVGWDQRSMWASSPFSGFMLQKASYDAYSMRSAALEPESAKSEPMIKRTVRLDVIANDPAEFGKRTRAIAEQFGGYLVSMQSRQEGRGREVEITIRVPAAAFDPAREQIMSNAARVRNENIETQDVTRDFTDREARLRSFRAEEEQYLALMKQARNVEEVLKVTEKLADVRTRLEQLQGEQNLLVHQVEIALIHVNAVTEADAELGFQWRPLRQLKYSFYSGMESLADYGAAMLGFLMHLPALLLWIATLVIGARLAWRLMNWMTRGALARQFEKSAPAEQ